MTQLKSTITRRVGVLQLMLFGILSVSVLFFLLVVQTVIPTLARETDWLPRPTGTSRDDRPKHQEHFDQVVSHPNGNAVAYDEHGNPGYVHDPYYVKNNPLKFTFQADGHEICEDPVGQGEERRRGSYALRKIVIMPAHIAQGSKVV